MKKTTNGKTGQPAKKPALRKLTPTCKLPTGAVLRKLSARESQRLRLLLTEVLECVYSPRFARAGAEQRFAPEVVSGTLPEPTERANPGLPERGPTLTREQEIELFLSFNYCRYRMMKILRAFAGKRLTAAATRELLKWDRGALHYRDQIIQANLGLVPSMVERSRLTGVDFAELISEGQMALLRSVDKFDCSRGFKFSTYACRAILTSISRAVAMMSRYRAQFPTEYDPDLQKSDFIETRRADDEAHCMEELLGILANNTADLTVTEQKVLSERFGVRSGGRGKRGTPKTLRQVAEVFGVTKERVRQIQNKALEKLRGALDEQVFAA